MPHLSSSNFLKSSTDVVSSTEKLNNLKVFTQNMYITYKIKKKENQHCSTGLNASRNNKK